MELTLWTRQVLPFSKIGLGLEGAGRLCHKYVNPSSPAGKLISEFNDCTKPIKKSVPLTRAATYPGWREHIFHTIKILEIEDIILLKQKKSPKENATVTALWKHHNI